MEQSFSQFEDSLAKKSLLRSRGNVFRDDASIISNTTSILGSGQTSVLIKEKTDQLYTHFLAIIQSSTDDIFETVQNLWQVLQNTVDEMQTGAKKQIGVNNWIRQEMNTWSLIHCLYKDRLITQREEMEQDDLPLVNSEKLIVENLYMNNATLREHQLILDWLEQTSYEANPIQVAHYGDRSAMAWENTLHHLQNVGRTVFGGRRELVKSLDPDAPHRENLPLHDLDMDDQRRLVKHIFNCIRQGKIDEAQSLCEHCGQPWQAALLEGWRLFHDPNYYTNETKAVKLPIEGNPRRDLWKKCAYAMADSKKLDDFTRAVAGSLCGNLDSLLNVCGESWWDLLWAYLKVNIDIRVESEIRSCCAKTYCEMPEKYWDSKMSLERIFSELDGNKNLNVKTTAKSCFAMIQKFLILDDIKSLFDHMNEIIDTDEVTPQIMRLFAHLVLFIRQIGKSHQEEIGDRIIRSYVQCLMKMGDAQLVAFYTAALPSAQQIQIYSEFLENVPESSRRSCMEEAQSHGLDIAQIAKVTVERVQRMIEDPDNAKLLTGEMSDLDRKKISSLEFLVFLKDQRDELLWQANAMMRYFMAQRKIEAVKKAFTMIPTDSIQVLIQQFGGKNNLSVKAECSIREYLCHQAYLAAIDGYNDWVEFFYNKKPRPPNTAQGKNFQEKAASEHQEQIYQQDLERWKNLLKEQTFATKDLFYNVLLFPEKGWLMDAEDLKMEFSTEENANAWENRKVQMDNLRKLHIPDIALLLHKILTLAEEHRECMKLSIELAAEQNQLFDVFSKHKMSELLSKMAESSLALMNENMDPFGFSTN
ncbi:hypothetical protein PVAND_003200 [Polypedilum vanderplanki]|uniref:Nuclear pore complex protein n=1 Tax=Polypedilum vanderplanki TaxID=319348 RepID=A0A9J6BV15_POLVA|nr:hypothetical protein PVAND_003200 [Polypedilum vanderplanki]